jgi:hypothetical protein
MTKLIAVLLPLLYIATACHKDNQPDPAVDGDYVGLFYRAGSLIYVAPDSVQITLSKGTYTGHSKLANQPFICSGQYEISGDSISFLSSCDYAPEDPTLALSGKFKLYQAVDSLSFTRQYVSAVISSVTYALKKQ